MKDCGCVRVHLPPIFKHLVLIGVRRGLASGVSFRPCAVAPPHKHQMAVLRNFQAAAPGAVAGLRD